MVQTLDAANLGHVLYRGGKPVAGVSDPHQATLLAGLLVEHRIYVRIVKMGPENLAEPDMSEQPTLTAR